MKVRALFRRLALFLPFLIAACATEPPPSAPTGQNFPPLDFSYLEPIPLNVAAIDIQDHFVPSGLPPDVSQYDPAPPVAALRLMAQQRLKPAGSSGRAVFIINDASLTAQGDTITGRFSVQLEIFSAPGAQAGFATATARRQRTGATGDLPTVLYQFTRQMMTAMNVEFEYQVRHSLGEWLLPSGAVPPPVEQAPLQPGPPPVPGAPPEAGVAPGGVFGTPPVPGAPPQPYAVPPPPVPLEAPGGAGAAPPMPLAPPSNVAPPATVPVPGPAPLPPLMPPPAPPPG